MRRVEDPHVALLAAIAESLRPDYKDEAADWAGSPFAWIKTRPSRQVGKIGEQLVAGWCAAQGFDVLASGDSEADRVIAGHRVEVKFSTLWKSGQYRFQQIRDQNYDWLICLGVSPFDAHCWVMTKSLLFERVIGHMPQHAGKRGTDTDWLAVTAGAPPAWLAQCGGRLSDALRVLRTLAASG